MTSAELIADIRDVVDDIDKNVWVTDDPIYSAIDRALDTIAIQTRCFVDRVVNDIPAFALINILSVPTNIVGWLYVNGINVLLAPVPVQTSVASFLTALQAQINTTMYTATIVGNSLRLQSIASLGVDPTGYAIESPILPTTAVTYNHFVGGSNLSSILLGRDIPSFGYFGLVSLPTNGLDWLYINGVNVLLNPIPVQVSIDAYLIALQAQINPAMYTATIEGSSLRIVTASSFGIDASGYTIQSPVLPASAVTYAAFQLDVPTITTSEFALDARVIEIYNAFLETFDVATNVTVLNKMEVRDELWMDTYVCGWRNRTTPSVPYYLVIDYNGLIAKVHPSPNTWSKVLLKVVRKPLKKTKSLGVSDQIEFPPWANIGVLFDGAVSILMGKLRHGNLINQSKAEYYARDFRAGMDRMIRTALNRQGGVI